MKIERIAKGNGRIRVIGGRSSYVVDTENEAQSPATLILFDQDMKDAVIETIQKVMDDDEIRVHLERRYSVCGSGLMDWMLPFKKVIFDENKRTAEWVRSTILTRVHKELMSL